MGDNSLYRKAAQQGHLTSFRWSLGCLRLLRGFGAFLVADLDARRFPGNFPDSRIHRQDKIVGVQRCFLKILRIGWKNLPARHLLPQHLDGSHVGELPPQTPVLVFGYSEPHPVVCRLITFVAEDEDNLVLNVDREAAEHGARLGRQRSDCVEHEFV